MILTWPRILPSITAATAGLFFLTSVLMAQAPVKPAVPVPTTTPSTPAVTDRELKDKQAANEKKFVEFKESLFRLAKRLEKSDRAEDKDPPRRFSGPSKWLSKRTSTANSKS